MSTRILVTGGAGYIGSQTCKALKQRGYQPVVFDDLSRGHSWAIKWGPLVKGRLQETERLAHILKSEKIEAVIHFAAFAYVGESMEKPELYYDNNFAGTLSLLKAMQMAGVKTLVFSSSCATYGIPDLELIHEDQPQNPINPYGRSKLMAEKMIRDSSRAWGLRACNLRYFNASGADLDGELGESHNPETHLIPLAIQAALKGQSFHILGNDYDTKDGTCIRDFVHVEDLAEAHVLALEALLKNAFTYESINLGTGIGHSVLEIIKVVEKLLGRPIDAKLSPRRAGDPPLLVADPSKALKVLGWKAQHSELETIIQSAIQWAQKQQAQIRI